MTHGHAPCDHGFTLIELVVSLALALVVFGAAVSLLEVHTPLAQAGPRRSDLQQRGRVATDLLVSELGSAGAWADAGSIDPGLAGRVPVLHPRRLGLRGADATGTARPDVITLVRAGRSAAPARLRLPVESGVLSLESGRGCAASLPLCGLTEADDVVVMDQEGRHDFFRVGEVTGTTAPLLLRQGAAAFTLPSGSIATRIETRTFYMDAAARQLRQYDGYRSDVPVIDDVVSVRFEYWGTPGVPEQARPWAVGQSSCWFDSAGQPKFGRSVAAPGEADVRLELDAFRDGPWCGEGDNVFDADLLRVRRVRAVVRLRAASRAARGVSSAYADPGSALTTNSLVPDMEVVADVTPRTLIAA
jgi:prepilin-type N-terminal cleavage/methylation domain-containing protein